MVATSPRSFSAGWSKWRRLCLLRLGQSRWTPLLVFVVTVALVHVGWWVATAVRVGSTTLSGAILNLELPSLGRSLASSEIQRAPVLSSQPVGSRPPSNRATRRRDSVASPTDEVGVKAGGEGPAGSKFAPRDGEVQLMEDTQVPGASLEAEEAAPAPAQEGTVPELPFGGAVPPRASQPSQNVCPKGYRVLTVYTGGRVSGHGHTRTCRCVKPGASQPPCSLNMNDNCG
jgi:hypothetical protein